MNKLLVLFSKICHRIACLLLRIEGRLLLRKGRLDFFIEHNLDKSFDYKKNVRTINPYFLKYGFKFSMVESEYYRHINGTQSDIYIPFTFFSHYLVPFLNGNPDDADKNTYRMILGANDPNKKIPFKMAKQIIWNRHGTLYNSENECCSIEEAVAAVMAYDKDIIIKPTLNTTWGKGVIKLKFGEKTEEKVRELISTYSKNFSFEECIVQHSALATLNSSSLNTTRIVTYRRPNGEIKFLFSFQRFGKEGEVVDNASAGGYFVGVHEDGTLDRIVKSYRSTKTHTLDDKCLKKIPFFDRMKELAIYLHTKLPYVNYVGWDLSMTEDGTPVVIEKNNRSAVEPYQTAIGPAFSREDLDELMPLIASWKTGALARPLIKFKESGKSDFIRQ